VSNNDLQGEIDRITMPSSKMIGAFQRQLLPIQPLLSESDCHHLYDVDPYRSCGTGSADALRRRVRSELATSMAAKFSSHKLLCFFFVFAEAGSILVMETIATAHRTRGSAVPCLVVRCDKSLRSSGSASVRPGERQFDPAFRAGVGVCEWPRT
jgi:hypothetical protein